LDVYGGITMKRIIVIISENENKKLEYLSKNVDGYTTYYNPENDKHPKVQKEFIENIIQDANIYHKQICIATNSPYVLTTLNNLLYAGRLKDKMSEEKFVEIMGNVSNYILPDELEVINLDTDKSIIEDNEILTEEIDIVPDEINKQYTSLYYVEMEEE
jgi:hypothetical protein